MLWLAVFVVKALLTGVLCIVHVGLAVLDAEPPDDDAREAEFGDAVLLGAENRTGTDEDEPTYERLLPAASAAKTCV